jgi:multicomponent Na+:H+ antiporter subunit D
MMPDLGLPPGLIMVLAAFAIPFLPPMVRHIWMLLAIALSATTLLASPGEHLIWSVMGVDLSLYHVDNLTFPFSMIFHIAAFLVVIYSWHVKTWPELTATLAYAGAAIAAVHAGDLISLFIWWEATAVTSVFIILAAGTVAARQAAMRYLIIQVSSGVLLIGGAALFYFDHGHITFEAMTLESMASWFIFLAFGIKAAFPFLNGWLQDAYPEATPTGTVALSAFTTKLAIYALARGFPGTEALIWIGAVMTAFPVFFAVIENDLRRVLSFSLNNQLGFMVVAVGIGTPMALNGAVAHAFVHIIYKALLFMSVGSVVYQTGTAKASELGGLYRKMPFTMLCCVIGAMSIAAFPLFSGFVAKSLTMTALGGTEYALAYLVLLFASAGVLEHSGIKIPYFTFFAHPTTRKIGKTPKGMTIAMGIAAIMCIGIGVFPSLLYQILPYAKVKNPYDLSHVTGQLQLLLLAGMAFVVLIRFGLYPPEIRSTVLNTDWFYRRLAPLLIKPIVAAFMALAKAIDNLIIAVAGKVMAGAKWIAEHPIAGPVIPGPAALVQVIVLLFIMAVIYAHLI